MRDVVPAVMREDVTRDIFENRHVVSDYETSHEFADDDADDNGEYDDPDFDDEDDDEDGEVAAGILDNLDKGEVLADQLNQAINAEKVAKSYEPAPVKATDSPVFLSGGKNFTIAEIKEAAKRGQRGGATFLGVAKSTFQGWLKKLNS